MGCPNDLQCFECIVFILSKYCNEWFVQFPNPPLNILSAWLCILRHFDESMFAHFQHHQIKIEFHLWQILSNAFSSFFGESDWLRVWDHVLTNAPIFFHLLPISIMLCCKSSLQSMRNENDIQIFFRHQQQMYAPKVIEKTYEIIKKLPKSLRNLLIFKQISNDHERSNIHFSIDIQLNI